MVSILYLNTKGQAIPELELNQIFINLYRNNFTEKELMIVQILEDDGTFEMKMIKGNDNKNGLTFSHSFTSDHNQFEEWLKNLDDKYNLHILITHLSQIKFVSKFTNALITIKKEELVRPL